MMTDEKFQYAIYFEHEEWLEDEDSLMREVAKVEVKICQAMGEKIHIKVLFNAVMRFFHRNVDGYFKHLLKHEASMMDAAAEVRGLTNQFVEIGNQVIEENSNSPPGTNHE